MVHCAATVARETAGIVADAVQKSSQSVDLSVGDKGGLGKSQTRCATWIGSGAKSLTFRLNKAKAPRQTTRRSLK